MAFFRHHPWIKMGVSGCLMALLSACQTRSPETAAISSARSSDTLKILSWQAPTILNPHLSTGFKDAEASRITLEPLASVSATGQLVPILAAAIPSLKNGGLTAQGDTVIWKLKPGLQWSDGKPVTADDVVFTYQFITNPQVGAISAGSYEAIKNVTALDAQTVKVIFKQPNPAWFIPFVGAEGVILPRHLVGAFNNEKARQAPTNLMPVGTGPYRVVLFKPGDTVVYEPNPYFRGQPPLAFKRVELKGGGDAVSAARAILQTGDADLAFNLQVEAPILQSLNQGGKGQIVADLGSLSERVIFNFTDPNQKNAQGDRSTRQYPHPFLTDAKVREAMSLAIDKSAIAEQLYGVTGQATSNVLLLPKVYASSQTQSEFNLKKAAQLLEETGWKDSNGNGIRDKKGVEMQIVFQTSVNPLRQKAQQVIKQGLQQIGIGVELKSIDPSIFFAGDPSNTDTVERFTADLQMFTTGNTNPDPTKYMKSFTCGAIPQPSNNWSGDNYGRYCNPQYDQLWQKATRTLDPKKREQLFIQMNDLLVKNFVVVPLIHRADVVGMSHSLTGVELTPWDRNTWNIQNWQRKKTAN